MSLKIKGTIFPQQKVTRNFPENFSTLRKTLNLNDAGLFFMLADATCSSRPTVNIEKIHVDIFKKEKMVIPKLSANQRETLEILNDVELMKELTLSRKETQKGRTVSWKKAKIPA
ncbi:MAG: hypothetical protein IIC67_01740 [Thaumarchaeota archaeon]|nr:hypothetical protein [Nitrososphaerota archaeon]